MKSAAPTVCHLGSRSKSALLRHFLGLGPEDRRLRFGHSITDEGLALYVGALDLSHDGVFVVRDARQRIIGAAHVAIAGARAEVGLSVLPQARGQGLGTRLFRQAAEFARTRDAARIDMHYISENQGIQHIARKCGMQIQSVSGESEAWLLLPTPGEPANAPPTQAPANEGTVRRAA